MTGPKHNKQDQEKVEGQEKVKGQELANVYLPASSATCLSYFGSKDGLEFVSKVQDECSVLIFKESGGSPDAQIMSKAHISMDMKEDRVTWRFPTEHKLVLYKQDISQSESMFVVTSIGQSNTGGLKTWQRTGVTKIDATIPLWTDEKHGEAVEVFHSILILAGKDNEDCVAFPLTRDWRAEDLTKCLVAGIGRYFLSVTKNDLPRFAVIQTAESEIFTKASGWCETAVAQLTKDLSADVGPTRGPGIRVRVEVGSLSDSKADVLVNTTSASLNLTKGSISNALLKKAGSRLQYECNKTYPRGIKPGQVAMTAGYRLPCKHVFHGALDKYGRDTAKCITRLREFIFSCLRKASELDLKTIAFPAIGTGILGYPADFVAAEMFGCVKRFQQQATRSSIQDVIFVVFEGDTTTVQIFKSFEKKMAAHEATRTKARTEATRTEAMTDAQSQTRDKVVFKIIGLPEDTSKAKHLIADKISVLKKDGANFEDTKEDNCVICMDQMTNPKKLSCGHSFCTDCIDQQFTYKQACPACGAVCGVITGDQPDGDMQVHYVSTSVAGYEQCGSIQITYTFRSGQQGPSHPQPGHAYKGITRTAYLPDNEEGQLVLLMLKVAFKRKVVFTIGASRTTGHEGVITWNDIHHKTDHRQNTQFGYPDPTYLTRVRDELAAKGVTEADVK